MLVYEKIKLYINENGIKQKSVAEKAGLSDAALNAILNGKKTLYADDFRAICFALNVLPEVFIDVHEEKIAKAR